MLARVRPWGGVLAGAVVGLVVGLVLAGGSRGLATYRSADLWALVPSGWKDAGLVAPYGTGLAGWFKASNPTDSIVVRATAPAGPSPQARAFARARALGAKTRSYVYEIQWPGGRSAWVVLYTHDAVHTALFEFNACSPAIAMTVTIDASTSGTLAGYENTLPQGAEPVCDAAEFTSPDRADIALPLHLPS
jgi:hypothetical protein